MATQLKNKAVLLLEAELAVVLLLTIVIFVINSLSHLLKTQKDSDNYFSAINLIDEKLSKVYVYGLNATFENITNENTTNGFSYDYSSQPLEGYNITQLDLRISWDKKPRPSSFNITTYILNDK